MEPEIVVGPGDEQGPSRSTGGRIRELEESLGLARIAARVGVCPAREIGHGQRSIVTRLLGRRKGPLGEVAQRPWIADGPHRVGLPAEQQGDIRR